MDDGARRKTVAEPVCNAHATGGIFEFLDLDKQTRYIMLISEHKRRILPPTDSFSFRFPVSVVI